MTFQDERQARLFELEPMPAVERKRRPRGKGRPRVEGAAKQLTIPRHLKIVNDEGSPDPCRSGPGICVVLHCHRNLIGWFTGAGNYHVPSASPDEYPGMTMPVATRRFGGASKQGSRPVTDEDVHVFSVLVRRRAIYLMDAIGSTCGNDLPVHLNQDTVGAILGVTGQRADQIEKGAVRKLKRNDALRAIAEESHEDPKLWASNHSRTSAKRSE